MKGQTLIEALVALGVLSILMYTIAIAVLSALSNSQFGKNQSLATQYAEEGIEFMHQLRDTDYTTFTGLTATPYCLNKLTNGYNVSKLIPTPCFQPNVDNFYRTITVTQTGTNCGTNIAQVRVNVAWNDAKCNAGNSYCHKVELDSCLSSATKLQTP